MQMTFRWYGEDDPVTLDKIRQVPGVTGIVSAIYDIPVGEVWPLERIIKLKETIEAKGLTLSVIESVPVHEDIKTGDGDRDRYIENYCETLRNLSKAGIDCVCYNFMPVFDWTRSDLSYELPDGSYALAYKDEKDNGIESYSGLINWLKERISYFNENGCRLSDHSLEIVPYCEGDARAVFEKKMSGEILTDNEAEVYKTAVLSECAKEYSRLGWAMQLHIGAMRNNNTMMFEKLGADTGFDSINDLCIAEKLSRLLDNLSRDEILPKTILYTLNPKDNYVLGTMIGNFQSGPTKSKLQFGSGWWFNDNEDGMISQLKALGNLGVLGRFIGMLTDSRSFVSYPRHEYFRRILCNLLGEWVESGRYPEDFDSLKTIVRGISYSNAKEYFGF